MEDNEKEPAIITVEGEVSLESNEISEDFSEGCPIEDEIPKIEQETEEEMIKIRNLEKDYSEELKFKKHQEALELKAVANTFFKSADYQAACNSYTQALKTCPLFFKPDISILYANRATAKLKLHYTYRESAIEDCTRAISLNPIYVKPRLRRAACYMAAEDGSSYENASEDLRLVLQMEPLNREAISMYKELQEKITERDKKMEEVMGDYVVPY
ncbi:hypothetical protein QYM36_016042 [Artemia franciscana]|uniref:Uncharacterized protein n=1 Tax=Artemia franciscana TaxID=6661 RepID=A0AA88HF76_ARTSF|nr:hypothetical protein QYM36_016042 [Artemia franciscana]